MTISKKRILTCIAAASIPLFFACSDDKPSSPTSDNNDPVSSESATLPESSTIAPEQSSSSVETPDIIVSSATDPLVVESSSSAEVVPESSSARFREPTEEEIAQEREFTANSATTEFQDLPSVYKSLDPTDKVAFVIRHAQREKSTGVESQLTEKGIEEKGSHRSLMEQNGLYSQMYQMYSV